MKKNLTFKIGLFCAALVLVATCFVTNAWAKYTQTVSAVDSARVAKWVVSMKDGAGAEFTDASFDIFSTEHEHILLDEINTDDTDVKLIAPGSNGSYTIKLDSTSEVSVDFTIDSVAVANTANIPLLWKITNKNNAGSTTTTTYKTAAELQAALEGLSWRYDVNGTDQDEVQLTIEWCWAYNDAQAEAFLGAPGYVVSDSSDTDLGVDGDAVYSVSFKVVATQVQPQD